MDDALDLELRRLIVGTNDQRRRVGQALYHLYRTLIFWRDKGLSFVDVARAWSAGGAMIFDAMATTLKELGAPEPDERLRRFVASVLERLAADVGRGDHMLVPFLRWLEARFPEITEMMRAERADSRIYDLALAECLAEAFARCARADRAEIGEALGRAAAALRT